MIEPTSKKLSFAQNVILDNGGFFIYDFTAHDVSGNDVWYLLAVSKSASTPFLNAIKQENVDVDVKKFGKILASGEGTKPPEDIKQDILDKYKI